MEFCAVVSCQGQNLDAVLSQRPNHTDHAAVEFFRCMVLQFTNRNLSTFAINHCHNAVFAAFAVNRIDLKMTKPATVLSACWTFADMTLPR